ncbi:MAG: glycosyltransferase family 4 protein [Acidobacteriota bacterium]
MRILHIDTGRQMRGGQWQALYLLEGLAGAGHQCLLLAPPSSPLLGLARARGLDAMPLRVTALPRLARGMDVVHAHDARAHTLGALALHRRLVVARRVAFAVGRSPFSDWKYARARHYIAVSEFVKGTLMAAGVGAEKVSVVYDGVPLAGQGTRGGGVIAPASDDPLKGAALVRRAAALGGFEVHFSADLPEDLRCASVFVYVSAQEGLGSAVLLAMAAGVPVVASRVGGLTEIVKDGETGLLIDNAPEAIAAAVARLGGDGELAARLARTARRQVEERFSVVAMVSGTLEVYERVR